MGCDKIITTGTVALLFKGKITMPVQLPIIAIVGRPNVGKSALFNAILQHRISIVHEQSGVTRDCVMAPAQHFGKPFLLVDTGGLGTLNGEKNVDLFDGMIREQVSRIIEEASVLIWVVNCQDGITSQDEEVGIFCKAGAGGDLCQQGRQSGTRTDVHR